MNEAKTYKGACHCGAVSFSVTTALDSLSDCNCSHCRRVGWVMQSVPAAAFVLESGADRLRDYWFNTRTINHKFCADCGVEPFATGRDGEGADLVMVNVNCLEGVPDIDRATIHHWDGKSF